MGKSENNWGGGRNGSCGLRRSASGWEKNTDVCLKNGHEPDSEGMGQKAAPTGELCTGDLYNPFPWLLWAVLGMQQGMKMILKGLLGPNSPFPTIFLSMGIFAFAAKPKNIDEDQNREENSKKNFCL